MLRLFLLIILMVFAAPINAQTQNDIAEDGVLATSDNFVLHSDGPVDAETLLSDLERFRIAVIEDLGLETETSTPPLRISIIDDPQTFALISPGGITAAIYLQSAIGNDIVVGYSSDSDHFLSDALDPGWLRLVLRHELVHHILETRYDRKLPIWLGEGLAEYYATYRVGPDGRATFGRAFPEQEQLADITEWLPMRTIIESMVRYPDFRTGSSDTLFRAQRLYYGQSWALAHFVMDQADGLARIHRFVDGWQPDADSEDSFEQAFGLRYAPLETRIREEIIRDGGNLRIQRITETPDFVISIRAAGDGDSVSNRLRLLMTYGDLGEQTQQHIDRLRAELTRMGADMPETHLLAHSLQAWRQGDWDASDRASARVLAQDPEHAQALKLRTKSAYGRVSERQMDEGLWKDAEAAAVLALAANPNDPELHLFRVAVSLPETDRLSPAALRSLDWLIDRDTHLRLPHTGMMMIPALIYEKRFDHADAVLDNAARWTENPADNFVIDRLRANVAAERAQGD